MPPSRHGPGRPGAGNGHRLLDTMDNAAFERDAHAEMPLRVAAASTTVEMGEFAAGPRTAGRPAAPAPAAGAPLCKPDLCRAMAPPPAPAKPPALRPNPWHRYKTVLFVATIAGFAIWIVAYPLLLHFDVI